MKIFSSNSHFYHSIFIPGLTAACGPSPEGASPWPLRGQPCFPEGEIAACGLERSDRGCLPGGEIAACGLERSDRGCLPGGEIAACGLERSDRGCLPFGEIRVERSDPYFPVGETPARGTRRRRLGQRFACRGFVIPFLCRRHKSRLTIAPPRAGMPADSLCSYRAHFDNCRLSKSHPLQAKRCPKRLRRVPLAGVSP